MLKSPFGPHCMQCKDDCQGSSGEEPQPHRKEISLPPLLPAVGHSRGRWGYVRQLTSSNPISGLPTAVPGHGLPIEEGAYRRSLRRTAPE